MRLGKREKNKRRRGLYNNMFNLKHNFFLLTINKYCFFKPYSSLTIQFTSPSSSMTFNFVLWQNRRNSSSSSSTNFISLNTFFIEKNLRNLFFFKFLLLAFALFYLIILFFFYIK